MISTSDSLYASKDSFSTATCHNWNNGVIEKEPPYTEVGKKVYTCSNCHETRTEDIPKLALSLPVVTAVAGSQKVTLTWNTVAGATKYKVHHRLNGTATWSKIETTATSYTVTGLTNGKKYDFLVLAGNNSGWSEWTDTDIVSATPKATGNPVPQNVKATSTTANSVTLTWNAVSGATKYAVAYKQANGTYIVLTSSCTATNYTATGLTAGTTYKFLVQSYVDGNWSAISDDYLVSATTTA